MTTDNFCFYLQNRLIQTSQTGGQRYGDTSPFSIPWTEYQWDSTFLAFSLIIDGTTEKVLQFIIPLWSISNHNLDFIELKIYF
jgi:hypothetical protein